MKHIHESVLILTALVSIHSVGVAEETWFHFGGPTGQFRLQQPIASSSQAPTKRWQRTLGAGMSGVVVRGGIVYTSYLVPFNAEQKQKPESERIHREAVIALDADRGRVRWLHEYDAGWIEKQQAFGGRSRAPQATPALCGDHLISIGFTGIMHCLDRLTGEIVWRKDLVEEFESIPVQFGFAASPLPLGDRVIVLAGGKLGGLVCLDLETGSIIWKVPCNEASYATPVFWDRTDGEQIVFMTRNRIIGVKADDGKQLWDYKLPQMGLTNVPTPMPIDELGLLVSGQGVEGTRRLNVERTNKGFAVTEAWNARAQFFYCNWVRRADVLWGCDGSLLVAIDLNSGGTIGQFRGYNDANLLVSNDQMLIMDGGGHLSDVRVSDHELRVHARYAVLNERCWTPVTPSGNSLYCRGGDQLARLDFASHDGPAVAVVPVRKPVLPLRHSGRTTKTVDLIQEILIAYEKDGADAALLVYRDLREQDPESLTREQRRQLARMADDEGLRDFAKLIREQAAEDYPQDGRPADQPPSPLTTRGENGLLYVEFAIRNSGGRTIQAYVKGPAKHPFSYGLPLRPQHVRKEKWPVGTRLYRTEKGIRSDVLLTVKEEFAGETIDIPTENTAD